MAKLTTEDRKNLPANSFALPDKRAYPIEDKSHADNALSRVSANGTPEEKAKVRAAVKSRFGAMMKTKKRGA
jgi:hypothetical protein